MCIRDRYTLVLTLKRDGKTEEMVSSRVGFRNVVIKDSVFPVSYTHLM